jgi:hypothetical protein
MHSSSPGNNANLEPNEPAPLFHFAQFINNSQTIRRRRAVATLPHQ